MPVVIDINIIPIDIELVEISAIAESAFILLFSLSASKKIATTTTTGKQKKTGTKLKTEETAKN